MTQNQAATIDAFHKYVRKMNDYKEATAVMSWDLMTGAPPRGKGQRAEVIGMLATEFFKLGIAPEMYEMLARLSEENTYIALDPVEISDISPRIHSVIFTRHNWKPHLPVQSRITERRYGAANSTLLRVG